MNELQIYLDQHYLTDTVMASALGISKTRLEELLQASVFAAPSYTIRDQRLISVVFGEFDASGFIDARYFHRDMQSWMQRTIRLTQQYSLLELSQFLEQEFKRDFAVALRDLHMNEWPMPDAFAGNGDAIEAGLAKRCDLHWHHYQAGIFGLCVARPLSAAAIAEKEVLQEKLTNLSVQPNRDSGVEPLLQLIARYEKVSMPFTHLEYPRSSRFRLVEQLRHQLLANTKAREDYTE